MGKSIALMIAPGEGGRAERQNWMAGIVGKPWVALGSPFAGCAWLVRDDRFTGSISPDGKHWAVVGETASLPRIWPVEMWVSSSIDTMTTTVTFDNQPLTAGVTLILRK